MGRVWAQLACPRGQRLRQTLLDPSQTKGILRAHGSLLGQKQQPSEHPAGGAVSELGQNVSLQPVTLPAKCSSKQDPLRASWPTKSIYPPPHTHTQLCTTDLCPPLLSAYLLKIKLCSNLQTTPKLKKGSKCTANSKVRLPLFFTAESLSESETWRLLLQRNSQRVALFSK